MSNEELRRIDETVALLVQNGFVINEPDVFAAEIGNENLISLIDRLNDLQETINRELDVDEFYKSLSASVDRINEIVNNDTYFRNSKGSDEFLEVLTGLQNEFKLAQNYLKAEESMKKVIDEQELNYRDMKQRLHNLKNDPSIDAVARTTETIKLAYGMEKARDTQREAKEYFETQKKLYEESLRDFNIVAFRNEFLKRINALDNSYRNLSMDPHNMEELANVIRDARDKIVVFGFESQRSQYEFEELLKKFGLEFTKENVMEVTRNEEVKEETVTDEVVEEKIEKPVKYDILTIEELAIKLRELNPEVVIDLADPLYDPLADFRLFSSVNVEDLVLPEDCYLNSRGHITNKNNTASGQYIDVEVEPLEKELTDTEVRAEVPVETDSVEPEMPAEELKENSELEPTTMEELNYDEIPKEEMIEEVVETPVAEKSSVPSGKTKVKRSRTAIVAPYVSSVLSFAAIGAIAAIPLGIGIIPTGLTAGAVSGIAQALHGKLAKDGKVDLPEYKGTELENTPEDALWVVSGGLALKNFIKEKCNILLEGYRNKKISKMAAKMRAAEEEERKATEAKKLAETKQAEETLAVEEPKTEEKTPAEDFVNSIEQEFEDRYENLDLGDSLDGGLGGR